MQDTRVMAASISQDHADVKIAIARSQGNRVKKGVTKR
jgi:hypothetical protein